MKTKIRGCHFGFILSLSLISLSSLIYTRSNIPLSDRSISRCMERRRIEVENHKEQDVAGEISGGGPAGRGGERLLQWGPAETREFLFVRAELDRSFGETKRNKPLWESLSSRMLTKGFSRTPDQCKSKWKNLLTRFKGTEALEGEGSKQFPFYEEMRYIFSGRMQRLLSLEKEKGVMEEEGEHAQQNQEDGGRRKKKKIRRAKNEGEEAGLVLEELEWALMELGRRQKEREKKWLHAAETRETERRAAEMEWRAAVDAVSGERAEMERRWREMQEERQEREENRAERLDSVISAIVARLDGEEDDEGG